MPKPEPQILVSEEGSYLVFKIKKEKRGKKSKSGKNFLHATSSGNQPTGYMIDGKELILGLNAYTPVE